MKYIFITIFMIFVPINSSVPPKNAGEILVDKYFKLLHITKPEECAGLIVNPTTVCDKTQANSTEEYLDYEHVFRFIQNLKSEDEDKKGSYPKPKVLRVCHGKLAGNQVNKGIIEVDVKLGNILTTLFGVRENNSYNLFKLDFYNKPNIRDQCILPQL
ncbi:unnamed protein product [Caenorhabditis angaria]|uniref:Uncharacterized protein n=1 Tax=Caenorhabditis angaria TaxID=860376 RepID=A0A9P1MZS6_9PELO|nr:unnamed protein product [Caenorhabditis angaria]